ncbi:MAG: phage minor tail protein L [Micrococcales bacterium]|nr:phage minor tail protein L [Micrococcales bacterium]
MTVPFSDLQAIAPSTIIELFELQLNVLQHGVSDIYRFHAGTNLNANGAIVWGGNTYLRFPVDADGFEYSGKGTLPRPRIRVSNLMGTITALLLTLPSGMEGAKVTRIRTLARYIDAVNFPGNVNPYGTPDSTAMFPPEIFYIDRRVSETRDVVEFELASAFDLQGVRAPKRQCISSICQWQYRQWNAVTNSFDYSRAAECSYTGTAYFDANDQPVTSPAADVCGKRLSSCKARFQSIPLTGSTTRNSNLMTVSNTSSLLVTMPVFGVGIPSGTTITAINSSTSITLSANATASTVATQTGTASATGSTLTVSSGSSLTVGASVSGTYIPSGTTISSISSNTVTLNQRPYWFTRQASFSWFGGPYLTLLSSPRITMTDVSNIVVGMRVFGSHSVDTTVTGVYPAYGFNSAYITLASPPAAPSRPSSYTLDLYFIPASPSSATYTFNTSPSFVFRSTEGSLPFGSFPGVGTYYS